MKEVFVKMLYLLVYPLLWLVSQLPMAFLYRISDVCYFIIHKVFKYRVTVVKENLRNAFPQKSESELQQIERSFYQFLCDFFVETIKGISISEADCHTRYHVSANTKLEMKRYLDAKQAIVLTLGHYGMWELGGAIFGAATNMYVNVIYRPLSSTVSEKLMKTIRSRFGNLLVPMNDIFKVMLADKAQQKIRATAFAIDQAAPPESAYWTTFLNQESSVFLGAEKLATKFNYPVVHVWCVRKERGYYEIHTKTLCEVPKQLKPGDLTEIITKDIERIIVEAPAYWLWSHKRWKHKREKTVLNERLPSSLSN